MTTRRLWFTCSQFYGMTIMIHYDRPRVFYVTRAFFPRAVCGAISGKVLDGKLPNNYRKVLLAWVICRREQLKRNIRRLQKGHAVRTVRSF